MASVIDKLPESERKKVIDALLAGAALRDVAKIAGVSHTAVGNYKDKVLAPAFAAARKLNALQALAQSPQEQVVNTAILTRATLAADPFIARIAKHQATIDSAITEASAKKDSRGVAALVGTDFRGIELHARLAGRLDQPGANQVNINIVCPAAPSGPADPVVTLDITPGR